jgi:hypothetical protein
MIPFSNYIKSITLGIHQAEQQIKELKFDTEYASYNKKPVKDYTLSLRTNTY